MSPAASPQLDALVVGAGWAGLQCALQLAQAGKRVVCLEARKRLGGRAFTHTWDDNTPMDNSERQAAAAGAGAGGSRAYAVDFGASSAGEEGRVGRAASAVAAAAARRKGK